MAGYTSAAPVNVYHKMCSYRLIIHFFNFYYFVRNLRKKTEIKAVLNKAIKCIYTACQFSSTVAHLYFFLVETPTFYHGY